MPNRTSPPRESRSRAGARRADAAAYNRSAAQRMRWFRQRTTLAVAVTAMLLLAWRVPVEPPAQAGSTAVAAVQDTAAGPTTAESVHQATGALRGFWHGFVAFQPKIAIAIVILVLAGLLSRAARAVLRSALRSFSRADAFSALAGILIWVLALGVALSVLAGDVRTLIGSLGLIGLALSWALQTPIESFTGWIINSFRGYYRVGDRIAVGEVFGDVFRIDFLTTTVWEAGGPGKPVRAAQPTGAMITFPNSEVLRNNVVNYTRDFSYVWDEIAVGIANESDLPYAIKVVREIAAEVVGPMMEEPATAYKQMLTAAGLAWDVSREPQVYVDVTDSWTNLTVRYLVDVRQRRKWASLLTERMSEELARPEHAQRILPSYPREDVRLLNVPAPTQRPATPAGG